MTNLSRHGLAILVLTWASTLLSARSTAADSRPASAESRPAASATGSAPATTGPAASAPATACEEWQAKEPVSTWRAGQGRTFYIATDGSDTWPGGIKAPFASLRRFLLLARPGDTCLIRGGVYQAGQADWSRLRTGLAGRPDEWITVRNYPGETVVIDRGLPGSDFTFLHLTRGNAYLRFQGLTFRNFRTVFDCDSEIADRRTRQTYVSPHHLEFINIRAGYSGSYAGVTCDGKPIRLAGGAHDVIIRGCEFHHVAGPGVVGIGGVSRVLIEDCVAHDMDDARGADGDADGFTFTHLERDGTYPTDVTLRRVSAWNCGEDGIDLKADRVVLEDCVVRNAAANGYKCWSLGVMRSRPARPLAQGRFRLTRCAGLDVGQTVVELFGAPRVRMTDCLLLGTAGCTWACSDGGETVLLYKPAFGWEPWRGRLRITGSTVLQRSAGPYPAVDIDATALDVLELDRNVYGNTRRPNLTLRLRGALAGQTPRGDSAAPTSAAPSGPVNPIILAVLGPREVPINSEGLWSAEAVDPEGQSPQVRWVCNGERLADGPELRHAFDRLGVHELEAVVTAQDGRSARRTLAVEVVAEPPAP